MLWPLRLLVGLGGIGVLEVVGAATKQICPATIDQWRYVSGYIQCLYTFLPGKCISPGYRFFPVLQLENRLGIRFSALRCYLGVLRHFIPFPQIYLSLSSHHRNNIVKPIICTWSFTKFNLHHSTCTTARCSAICRCCTLLLLTSTFTLHFLYIHQLYHLHMLRWM